MVSITGYFTVLDFGVNTAIVRYISKYVAEENFGKAREVYSTSFVFFLLIGTVVFIITIIIAFFFQSIFDIKILSRTYLFLVFIIVGSDLAFGLILSVFPGTLAGLQEYFRLNLISISISIIRSVILVWFLISGYGLLTLAVIQISATILKVFFQFWVVKKNYDFLQLDFSTLNRPMMRQIYNHSIYSFIISIAQKLLFYTDSIVIGSVLTISVIVYYSIPATLMDYVNKFMWSMISVLIPVVSSQERANNSEKNIYLYVLGTKYSLAICIPIIFILFTVGKDFIALWMGPEYGLRSAMVLRILLTGYLFAFSQMIAHALLKGISKHRILSFMFIGEAVSNLILSLALAKPYGIEGVALGTMIPMIIVNFILIPIYVCNLLGLNFRKYIYEAFFAPLVGLFSSIMLFYYYPIQVSSYLDLILYSLLSLVVFIIYDFTFVLEKVHRTMIFNSRRHLFSTIGLVKK